jgi:alkylresorcinol/alkylpyrone synthase
MQPLHKAHIHAIATAVPPHVVDEQVFTAHLSRWLHGSESLITDAVDLLRAMQVDKRHYAFTPEELLANHGMEWMNREYGKRIVPLAEDAAQRALAASGLTAKDIDLVISTSCTGFMIPPMDAHLANRMGMKADLKRLPITELGCAGGAAATARAADYLRAYPDHNVLVITAELTSATFQLNDHSKANLVASILFGDGIAAMVMSGRPRKGGGPAVTASASTWFPDTLDLMGFDLQQSGFHLNLSPRIPVVVKREIRPFAERLLAANGMSRADLSWFVLHPGGRKVLEVLEQTLEVGGAQTKHCWDALRQYGNLSSSMVIFILDELWRTNPPAAGTKGLMAAFGPAFGAEASLLSWE